VPGGLAVVDAVRRLACVPEGAALDLGGIARMWSADRAAAIVRTLSDDPAVLLEVGDDLIAVRGDHLVSVGDLDGEEGAGAIVLRDGHALASSSWNALLWSNDDGAAAHHLIDPVTGAPAEPASAVVIARDAAEADALATALAVRPALVSKVDACALVHGAQGERHTAAWEAIAV
jgi:thiamine biosynthesis lipoprotein